MMKLAKAFSIALIGSFAFGCQPHENESVESNASGSPQSDTRIERLLKGRFGDEFLSRWREVKVKAGLTSQVRTYDFSDSASTTAEAGRPGNLPGTIKLIRSKVFDDFLDAKSKLENKTQDVVEEIDFNLTIQYFPKEAQWTSCNARFIRFGSPIEGINAIILVKTMQNAELALAANSVNYWQWLDNSFVDACTKNWAGPGVPGDFEIRQTKFRTTSALTRFAEVGDNCERSSVNCNRDLLNYVRSRSPR